MLRRIAIGLLVALTALTPALSNACAASCSLADGGAPMDLSSDASKAMPCHGDTPPSDDGSEDAERSAMAAMCAFAAGGAISASSLGSGVAAPSRHVALVESSRFSFLTLPADKPPRR